MLDQTAPGAWLVRATDDGAPQALVESFATGYRLSTWSLIERERTGLGVYTSPELAETAWWRHLDANPES